MSRVVNKRFLLRLPGVWFGPSWLLNGRFTPGDHGRPGFKLHNIHKTCHPPQYVTILLLLLLLLPPVPTYIISTSQTLVTLLQCKASPPISQTAKHHHSLPVLPHYSPLRTAQILKTLFARRTLPNTSSRYVVYSNKDIGKKHIKKHHTYWNGLFMVCKTNPSL